MKKKFLLLFMILSLVLPYAVVCAEGEETDTISSEATDDTTADTVYSEIDTTSYYYDRFDNDAYKNVYRQLEDPAASFHSSTNNAEYNESGGDYYYKAFSITVSKKNWEIIGADGMQSVINAFIADNPLYFWMSSSFKYSTKSLEGTVCYVVEIICYDNYANGSARQVLVNNMDITIANYAGVLDDSMPDYQKEYLIHNAIIEDIYYNVESENAQTGDTWLYTADGVFNSSHKSATSFGYAKAFKAVMDYLGIKCIYVEGNTTETEDGNSTYHAHAWNMVCLDDGWYVVDVANDDPETTSGKDVLIYDYFNITSEKASDLVPATDWLSGIPTCNGTAYSISNVELLLANTDTWQDDNYFFFDKILDTYGLSVVLISIGIILILLVVLFRHVKARHKKRKQEKIKNTKTVAIDHSELDNELRNPPL